MESLSQALHAEAAGVPPLGDIDRATDEVTTSRRRWAGVIGVAAAVVVLLTAMVGPGWQPLAVEPAAPQLIAPQPDPTTPSEQLWPQDPQEWPGPLRGRGTLVRQMQGTGDVWSWQDPLDAAVGWVDVERVATSMGSQPHWYIELADKPPLAAGLEPGLIIAYGLVLDTNADGAADYLVGIDNDAQEQGDFHVWVTNLGTGETDEQLGPPYGYPIEFAHPDERRPDDPAGPPTMLFTFLGASRPADLKSRTVRFYAWTSATRDGQVVAYDYAPDAGWITTDTP
jgi:hypothetical protein